MEKDSPNVYIFIIFVCILITISIFIFLTGKSEFLPIYLAFLVVVWISTLGFWPWWNKRNKKKLNRINKKQPVYSPNIEFEENNNSEILLNNLEIRTNPQAKEVPYKE